MTLSVVVEQTHKLQYSDSVSMVAQQSRDALAGAVTTMDAKGEAKSADDLYDAGEYAYGEARSRRNPEMPAKAARRWLVMPPVIESGQHIETEDKWASATDPTSTLVTTHTRRVVRGKQDRKLGVRKDPDTGLFRVTDGGIMGFATEGKRPDAQVSLPSSQVLPRGSTRLTLEKIREAKRFLRTNDFGLEDEDELYCAITPNQEDDLLALAAASTPYQNVFSIEQLKEGKVQRLMGINWLMTNRLPVAEDDETVRLCPIWSKANIVEGVWQDVKGQMWNDSHAKNLPYVYVSAYTDCVRLQDKGVIIIECNED